MTATNEAKETTPKRYLQDFDRLQKSAKSDQELFNQMRELYPHWVANQSWLMFGFPQS